MRGVALGCAISDHDDLCARVDSVGDRLVMRELFRRPLTLLPRLDHVREVMQEVMGVVGSYDVLRSVIGHDVDMEILRPLTIHDDQQVWRGRIGMDGGIRRKLGRPSGLREELPNLDHFGTRKIRGVGFSHGVTFAGAVEHELAVGLLVGVARATTSLHSRLCAEG